MSDVEETIMIVDPEAVPNGKAVINVRDMRCAVKVIGNSDRSGRQKEDGYAVREGRWCNSGVHLSNSYVFLDITSISRFRLHQGHSEVSQCYSSK